LPIDTKAAEAKSSWVGLHVLSCPEECAPQADALAVGDGVQLWPRILDDVESRRLQSTYVATYQSDYRQDSAPRRSIVPRHSLLTTTSLIATRDCHNRCGFCYLSTDALRIKEAKKNRMPMGQSRNFFEGFHIRLANGVLTSQI
jgi:radical SAM superfamily enzyme YgiQ (UPF0313 family)